ncbi:unnamed protein product [Camellia sinensis]
MTPVTYHPTHDRTLPPPNQVISSEAKNILLRHMYEVETKETCLRTSDTRAWGQACKGFCFRHPSQLSFPVTD